MTTMSLLLALSLAPRAEAFEEHHFCWGAKIGPNYSNTCESASWFMNAAYANSSEGQVCLSVFGLANCTRNPNEGVYIGGTDSYGYWTHALIFRSEFMTGTVKAYGVFWTAPPKSGGGGGGGETPPGPEGRWFLRNSNTSGIADNEFLYGGPELLPVNGDWNGDGIDTPGAYKPSTGEWFLRNSNTSGVGEINFTFGGCCDLLPVAGDWNHDGIDTVGLYRPSTGQWFLRNVNSTGSGEINFVYGGGNSTRPITGDWNGDGTDTIGIVDESNSGNWLWYLRNQNNAGAGEVSFNYGGGSISEDTALVGDWNGDGKDTPGIYQAHNGQWYLRNSNTAGTADLSPIYGGGSESHGISGDWNGDGIDSIGMRR